VLVFGNPGSGKSHLVTALAQELVVVKERKMHFTKCALLMQDLLAAKRDLRLSREIKRLSRFDGLIIDDLGYLQQSRDDMEVVFTLLAERYERGSVLMTSNLPFSKWEAIFKDAMMTAAAIDRLVHHSVIIELNIPSYSPLLGLLDLGFLVKLVQELAGHRGRGHLVSHHFAQPAVLAQTHEVIDALPAHRVQDHETLHQGRFVVTALPLLDPYVFLHQRRQSH